MSGRTLAQLVLVIVAVLCSEFDFGVCDGSTTEEISTLPTEFRDLTTDTTLFEKATVTEEPLSVFTTEDIPTTTQSPCHSVPEELKNITIYQENGQYKAKWGKPTKEECQTYKVSVNKDHRVITENFATLGNAKDLRCSEVKISAVDIANNVGDAVTRLVPGEIKNLKATPSNHEIKLTWDAPDDVTCVEKYVIYLDDQSYESSETSTELTDLEACTDYEVKVAAVSTTATEGPLSSVSTKTSKPTSLSGSFVANLRLTQSSTAMRATWDPPVKVGACIGKYQIVVWDQNQIQQDYSTSELFYDIEPIVPCMQYNFQITPTINDVIWGQSVIETEEASPQPTPAPENQRNVWGQTDVIVTVKVVDHSENMCKLESIDITCKYSGSEEPLEWMVTEGSESLDSPSSDNSRPPQDITVNGLSPYTDYKCEIVVVNSEGTSEPTILTGKTLEDVPSAPRDITSSEEDMWSILISWREPWKIPGILGNYRISITYEDTNHFIPDSCDIVIQNVTGDEQENTVYSFEHAIPNSRYLASVQASTTAGFGDSAELVFTSKPQPSEVVRNLNNDIINNPGEEYDVTAHITWLTPCNTNGKLLKFTYKLEAKSLDGAEDILNDGMVDVNENETNEEYELTLQNIEPLYDYKVSIFAVTSTNNAEEIIGEANEVSFSSPDGFPSAPVDVSVKDITATTGIIQWKEPINKNGKIVNYEITIQTEEPNHLVSDIDCTNDYPDDMLVVQGTLDDTGILSYQYINFLSDFNYTLIIRASTSAGYGISAEFQFQTEQSRPEEVRDVSSSFNVVPGEEYKATVEVTFIQPCHLNGDFLYFKLTLIGTRDGFEEHQQEIEQSEYAENKVTTSLKPEYDYEGFIEVYTLDFTSDKTFISHFESSPGVPENSETEPQEPDVTDPFTAKFELSQETFSNTMGEIRYFAIILAPADYNPDINYGIFNDEWPSTGHWSKDGELAEYQTTPKMWNPFLFKNSKNSVYVFTIGKDKCDDSPDNYCNGPLRPDTEYSLRVRGFTSCCYRDSTKITFWTPSDINYGALIGGIVGGAVGLLLIFIIIIIFWRRRKNKKKEQDTVMEVLPLVPPPIPIKNFVAYYNDHKTNLNKLKAEYSYLETKSVAEQLPTTFAMTDDNKKKNRYINILPYDETRVNLDRDKNDNYTDYINASFIKGYSDNTEYIATQGPLESTVVDFWRMVIQENVSVIVMVAQFVEHDKAKCHQYFPNNHETMNIGDGIEIRCANEVPLGGYVKRTLMVQRELMQMTITHLQYIEWPDFGCPNNTESMLDFCNIVRQCIEQYKTKTIVHCSAGVGRTGTLIALDILFQTIDNKGDIDIFKTVLNLRKQRVRMVQTEKQYMFIHACLAEYISNPKKEEYRPIEPIYENVTIKKTNDEEESATDVP